MSRMRKTAENVLKWQIVKLRLSTSVAWAASFRRALELAETFVEATEDKAA